MKEEGELQRRVATKTMREKIGQRPAATIEEEIKKKIEGKGKDRPPKPT